VALELAEDGAAAAVALLELELEELPQPARTIADITSAATPPAPNFTVLRLVMISLPIRGFHRTRQSGRVTNERPRIRWDPSSRLAAKPEAT